MNSQPYVGSWWKIRPGQGGAPTFWGPSSHMRPDAAYTDPMEETASEEGSNSPPPQGPGLTGAMAGPGHPLWA